MKQQPRPARTTWVKHHKKRNYAIIATVTALLVIIIIGFSSITPSGVQVGQQAPDFTLPDINNTNFHLASVDKPVLLEFMRTTCPACTAEASILSQLYSTHGTHVAFVSISIDPNGDQPSVLSAYARSHNNPWTWIRDTSGISQTYGITATPTIFLLDSNGIIKNKFLGTDEANFQVLDSACQALS